MTDTFQTLLERLQNADEPDREIDALIGTVFKADPNYETVGEGHNQRFVTRHKNYTASLDASIELVEKAISILPKCGFRIYSESEGLGYALIHWGDPRDQKIKTAYAKTLPLALLTALVRALIAEQE